MDYLIDSHYELYMSDFLDEAEILELVSSREVTEEDMLFWCELVKGGSRG